MKLYDEGGAGIAMGNGFVETHAGNLHIYADRTQAGDIVFITTDNFKKYIPIEWIEKYNNDNWFDAGTEYNAVTCMLDQWREEHESKDM